MVTHITVQYDNIPASLTLHWNVDGMPGRVGDPQEIWVLPVIAALVLFMNVGLAWSIAQFDHFAARLMLSSTLVVHVIIWIALFTILH
jgi:lipoprotein signal peptidase